MPSLIVEGRVLAERNFSNRESNDKATFRASDLPSFDRPTQG